MTNRTSSIPYMDSNSMHYGQIGPGHASVGQMSQGLGHMGQQGMGSMGQMPIREAPPPPPASMAQYGLPPVESPGKDRGVPFFKDLSLKNCFLKI